MRRPTMTLSIIGPQDRPAVYGDGIPLAAPIPGDRCDPAWVAGTLGGEVPRFVADRLGWFGLKGEIRRDNPNEVWVAARQ
jgi:hypothetical protein